MDKAFAKYTRKILEALPFWFKMKKDPGKSIGAEFLNVSGLELDQVEYVLAYAYEQMYLQTADIDFTDIVYKAVLPSNVSEDNLGVVFSSETELLRAQNVKEFLIASNSNMMHPEVFSNDPFYVDFEKCIIYTRRPYDATGKNPSGKISVIIGEGTKEKPLTLHDVPLTLHHVWNFFDEFGMLFSCPRLSGERNEAYKERLLDVFKNKANSSRSGLASGISRELNLRQEKIWYNSEMDYIIEDPMVVLNEIKVDGEYVDISDLFITDQNTVLIPGNLDYIGRTRTVSYISGLEMHQLHNKVDYSLQRQLFNIDKTATNLLKYYVDRIREEVPIMWNQWRWNEGYWDVADEEMSGFAYLPTIMDAKINGFEWYTKGKTTNIYDNKPPTLADIYAHPNPVNMVIGETVNVISDILLSSITVHPSPIYISRGDIIEFSSYGKDE